MKNLSIVLVGLYTTFARHDVCFSVTRDSSTERIITLDTIHLRDDFRVRALTAIANCANRMNDFETAYTADSETFVIDTKDGYSIIIE